MNGRVADSRPGGTCSSSSNRSRTTTAVSSRSGPTTTLYIALGDGGASNDEGPGHASGGNGQSLRTLLGKILRIDPTPSGDAPYTVPDDNPFVGTDDARPEIWAYGLRNPWRFSFDPTTATCGSATSGRTSGKRSTSRPRRRAATRARRQLRLEPSRGHARVPRRPAGGRGAAGVRAVARRRRVLGDRRLRVPRHRDPGARGRLRVHRLLRRHGAHPHAVRERRIRRRRARARGRERRRASARTTTGELYVLSQSRRPAPPPAR